MVSKKGKSNVGLMLKDEGIPEIRAHLRWS